MNQASNSLDSLVQDVLQTELGITPNSCSCHYLDPEIHRLILWANKPAGSEPVSYTLRIGSQRFTSLASQDKHGQVYWRFKQAGEYTDGLTTIAKEN